MRRKYRVDGADAAVAELAARQHGLVLRGQALGLGLSGYAIDRRIRAGRLHVVHRGVYAVGHRLLSAEGQWMAAALAGGPAAALSHRSAAALWGLVDRPAVAEVTVPRWRRSRRTITFHCERLERDEVTTHHGIPLTSVSRTLFDLAVELPRHRFERALREAEFRRLGQKPSLPELLDRHPHRPGNRMVRMVLADGGGEIALTRSELEQSFLAFLERAGLPMPRVNAAVALAGDWVEVDCLWEDRGVVVELDGHAAHGTRSAFERDRARDRALNVAGWRVIRVTWRQFHRQPAALARDLRALLRLADPAAGSGIAGA